jgi:hypothetical protein
MRPGRVNLAADRIVSFLPVLLAKLCGLALGATLSSLGMTQAYKKTPRFQSMFTEVFRKISHTGVDTESVL